MRVDSRNSERIFARRASKRLRWRR